VPQAERRYLRLVLVAGLTVVIDQLSKAIIQEALPLAQTVQVIPGLFSITHIRNTGGAFGLLAGRASTFRTVFFLGVSGLSVVILCYLYAGMAPGNRWASTALCLICGGALGNLVDRVRLGEVVDFLDFYVGPYHWPAFNLADCAISVGVAILVLHLLWGKSELSHRPLKKKE